MKYLRRNIKGIFRKVFIELTNHCNMSCDFCPDSIMTRKRGFMDLDLAKRIINELSEKDMTRSIDFHLMGEPMLHPHYAELATYVHEKGLNAVLYTNCTLLNKKNISKLVSIPLSGMVLSVQSSNAGAFINRRARNINFEDYIKGVESFVHSWINSRNRTPLSIHYMTGLQDNSPGKELIKNRQECIDILSYWRDFLHKIDPDSVEKYHFLPKVNLNNLWSQYMIYPGISVFFKYCHTWDGQMLPAGYQVRPNSRGICKEIIDRNKMSSFAILWNGETTYCCSDYDGSLELGNVSGRSIEDVYFGDKASHIRDMAEKEKIVHPTCQSCRGRVYDIKSGKKVSDYKNWNSLLLAGFGYYKAYGVYATLKKAWFYIRK